jgi:hypothetical protein
LIRKPVKNWKTHARHVKRANAAIVVPAVKVADAAKAVAIADRVVMAVDVVKAAATVVHAKSVQKAETTAGEIPTMFQHS